MEPCTHGPRSRATRIASPLGLMLMACVLLATPRPASAQLWNELGDAGQTLATAQTTAGNGPLTNILGTIQTDTDVDLYCIHITNPALFSATLQCVAINQNDLWLFAANGLGIEGNDGCSTGSVLLSSLFVFSAGTYYLAVSADAADAQSPGGNIWLSPAVQGPRAPDGPGGGQPLIGWSGASRANFTSYNIQLSGCGYCDAPVRADGPTWGTIKQLYR